MMSKIEIVKVSQKGEITIPNTIRKQLNIVPGDELIISSDNSQIQIQKRPSNLDWDNLIKNIPKEKVEIDKNGNYDPKKSPHFHDWMENG